MCVKPRSYDRGFFERSKMNRYDEIIKELNENRENIYFIHYSCQSLSDDNEGYSPRITSIAILHMNSSQMHSFSIHLIAEEMHINRDKIFELYDSIESQMLAQYFSFIDSKKENAVWIHWNMSNVNYGFEALEHRYKVLTSKEPIHIAEYLKYNLSNIIKKKYGSSYAKDPKMLNLMLLNGDKDQHFLSGDEEVRAFKAKEFVKLHSSTMCKVYFFKDIFIKLRLNKIRTENNQLKYKINELYQNPIVQIISIVGVVSTIISLLITFFNNK